MPWTLPSSSNAPFHWPAISSTSFTVLVACSRIVLHSRQSHFWTAMSTPHVQISAPLSSPVFTSLNCTCLSIARVQHSGLPHGRFANASGVDMFKSRSVFDLKVKFMQSFLPPALLAHQFRCTLQPCLFEWGIVYKANIASTVWQRKPLPTVLCELCSSFFPTFPYIRLAYAVTRSSPAWTYDKTAPIAAC